MSKYKPSQIEFAFFDRDKNELYLDCIIYVVYAACEVWLQSVCTFACAPMHNRPMWIRPSVFLLSLWHAISMPGPAIACKLQKMRRGSSRIRALNQIYAIHVISRFVLWLWNLRFKSTRWSIHKLLNLLQIRFRIFRFCFLRFVNVHPLNQLRVQAHVGQRNKRK